MSRKAYGVLALVLGLAACSGLPDLVEGIRARGLGGVNYGGVGFPLLLCGWALWRHGRRT